MKHDARARSNKRSFDQATFVIFKDLPSRLASEADPHRVRRDIQTEPSDANGYFQQLTESSAIDRSFDAGYYRQEYPDIDFDRFEPLSHFLKIGWYEGRNPSAFFDTVSYLQKYSDVEHANINPYCHYLAIGAAEGRQASSSVTPSIRARLLFGRPLVDWVRKIAPYLDEEFYRKQLRKPFPAGINLAAHYAFRGWREGMRPHPNFDPASVEREDILNRYLVNPLLIQIEANERDAQDLQAKETSGPFLVEQLPSPFEAATETGVTASAASYRPDDRSQKDVVASEFDPAYYRAQYPDVVEAGVDPLEHFFYTGWCEGRDPNQQFDTSYYLETYPDARADGLNPFWHFLKLGRTAGRRGRAPETTPSATQPQQFAVEQDGSAHQLAAVQSEFDVAYYLAAYPDVSEAGVDPLQHFFFTGGQEGRNPNQTFNSRYYLAANEDVRDASLNPFWHYLVSGRAEGRLPKRPGGYKRINIDAAVAPSQRAAIDPEPHETAITTKELSARLGKILKKRKRGLVLSFSHDCYTKVIGGTQIFISDEQKRFNEQDYTYLQVSPRLARLSFSPKSPRFQVRVVADGDYVGLVELKSLSNYLKAKYKRKQDARAIFVVHCALGFHVPDMVQVWENFQPNSSIYWLHDYSSLCPGFNLLRNDAEFCGAPPKDSMACRVCVYGRERDSHLSDLSILFETCNFDVLSPSKFALDLWLRSTELPRRSVGVHPHWRLAPIEGSQPRLAHDGPLPIAFLGYQSANKGWQIFEEIVRQLNDNTGVRFFHFAARNVATLPKLEFVRTEVTPHNRWAALRALADHGIKILLLLSPWPETFSFVLHEAIAAGAYIFCLKDSGNVADVVEREKVGKIFQGVDDLVDFIRSGAAAKFVSESDGLRPSYKIENCGTTASSNIISVERS